MPDESLQKYNYNHDTTEISNTFKAEKRGPDKHDENGGEVIDPTPMQPPLGYKKSLSLSEQIAQQVRVANLKLLEDMALEETEEEADDFEVGEDYEPLSKYENDHVPTLGTLKKRALEINNAIKKRQTELAIQAHKDSIRKTSAVTSPPAQPLNQDVTTVPDET